MKKIKFISCRYSYCPETKCENYKTFIGTANSEDDNANLNNISFEVVNELKIMPTEDNTTTTISFIDKSNDELLLKMEEPGQFKRITNFYIIKNIEISLSTFMLSNDQYLEEIRKIANEFKDLYDNGMNIEEINETLSAKYQEGVKI